VATLCNDEANGKVVDLNWNVLICALKQVNTTKSINIGILNFLLKDFQGLPGIFISVGAFFECFLDIMFLLLIIFIFDQLMKSITSMTDAIFEGASVGDVGMPTLKSFTEGVAKAGVSMANLTRKGLKTAAMGIANRVDDYRNRNAFLKYGDDSIGSEDNAESNNDTSVNLGSDAESNNDTSVNLGNE
ncbi:MAG: hypothetical protein LBS34_00360, partial [Rickettsiales bacterium]|jgi:hypothetical protein|nr:hypothetical protein [Rickettsiales bacterium]